MINIEKLNYSFDKGFSINVENLKLKTSCVNVLLGKNGSGKSTLIKLVLGIYYSNNTFVKPDLRLKKYRSKVGVLLEGSDSIYPRMSVWDNAKYLSTLRVGNFDKDYTRKLIKALRLEKYIDTPTQKLSTGNKRKAAILSVLATNPQYLFMDEPTLGLDLESVEILKNIFIQLKKEGKTILLTSHDSNFMSSVADNFVLINNGVIESKGATESEFNKALDIIRKTEQCLAS